MPEKTDAKDVTILRDVALTITYDPKQINLKMNRKDFINKVNMDTFNFLNDLSDDFIGYYELMPTNKYVHAHVYVKTVRSNVIGRSKLLDGMFTKIKIMAQQYRYIGHICLDLCSRHKDNVEGWIKYCKKDLVNTADGIDMSIEELTLKPHPIILQQLNIKDLMKSV